MNLGAVEKCGKCRACQILAVVWHCWTSLRKARLGNTIAREIRRSNPCHTNSVRLLLPRTYIYSLFLQLYSKQCLQIVKKSNIFRLCTKAGTRSPCCVRMTGASVATASWWPKRYIFIICLFMFLPNIFIRPRSPKKGHEQPNHIILHPTIWPTLVCHSFGANQRGRDES